MEPTVKQKQLAETIDQFVKATEQDGGGDTEILVKAYLYMTGFKELLDTCSHEQMQLLAEAYPGFYRLAKLLESIAQGLHDGTIKAPTVN
jgi:hypothetical protein